MIVSTRWNQWETNSSSVHQIVIPLNNDYDEEAAPTSLVLRYTDFFADHNAHYHDSNKFNTAQDKLDYLVYCIIGHIFYEDESLETNMIYRILKLGEMIESTGCTLRVDIDSFKDQNYYTETGEEIIQELVKIIDEGNQDLLEKFLFNPESSFATDDNSYYYDYVSKSLINEESSDEKFIVTDNY